ncbi:MAG: AAA family ATPase [Atopobiaceae bacterium]|nr:AAA family ATPase [Atopobiaceae bacterium]
MSLANVVEASRRRFVAILDEWDAPIRETPNTAHEYLELLRALFKNSATTDRIFAAAYMTGIFPIKQDKGQSAVSDFWEFSMLAPGPFAPYVGFLESDVRALCDDTGLDFGQMKHWYDGYELNEIKSVYNPYAVMRAVRARKYGSYWRYTSAADMLLTYIDLDFEGLQNDVVRLMAGEELEVETGGFKNDPALIGSRDDALTLMIHLGYLTFEEEFNGHGWARIPNAEIRTEFEKVLRQAAHLELVKLVRASDELLDRARSLDGAAVAAGVARVHDSNYAPA